MLEMYSSPTVAKGQLSGDVIMQPICCWPSIINQLKQESSIPYLDGKRGYRHCEECPDPYKHDKTDEEKAQTENEQKKACKAG